MEILFLEAPYTGKVELCSETISYIKNKKYTQMGLYASVQFVGKLEIIETQLKDLGITVITSHPDRAHVKGQLLGCDNYHNSLNLDENIDAYLYIGDGRFHPLALVYAQKDSKSMKEVICNDPINKIMEIMGVEDIITILKKYRGSLLKFLTAKSVGILITIKPGQEQFKPALLLEKRYPDKKFYFFIDNVISFDQLENFNFIDVWVNTACPMVGFDDQEKFLRGVINLNDAISVEEILGMKSVFNQC